MKSHLLALYIIDIRSPLYQFECYLAPINGSLGELWNESLSWLNSYA